MQTGKHDCEEPRLPPFACPRYGGHEHDWLDCPECITNYEALGEPRPSGRLAGYAMDHRDADSLIDKSYIDGFNAALRLAEIYIDEDLRTFIEHGEAWQKNSSLEEWFPYSAALVRVIQWLQAGKYRTVHHRHDGSFRLVNEALNIWADGETLEGIVDSEWWPKFRDCTERAP